MLINCFEIVASFLFAFTYSPHFAEEFIECVGVSSNHEIVLRRGELQPNLIAADDRSHFDRIRINRVCPINQLKGQPCYERRFHPRYWPTLGVTSDGHANPKHLLRSMHRARVVSSSSSTTDLPLPLSLFLSVAPVEVSLSRAPDTNSSFPLCSGAQHHFRCCTGNIECMLYLSARIF